MSCGKDAEHCKQIAGASGTPEAMAVWAEGRGASGHCPDCGGFLTVEGVCNNPHTFSMSLAGGSILGVVDTTDTTEALGICPDCGATLSVVPGQEDWCMQCEELVTAFRQISIPDAIKGLNDTDTWEKSVDELISMENHPVLIPALTTLCQDTDADTHAVSGAMIVLGAIGNESATMPLLTEGVRHKSSDVRNMALLMLKQKGLRAKVSIELLPKIIQKDRSFKNRMAAAEVLGNIGDEQAIAILIEGLKVNRHKDVVESIEIALRKIGSPAIPALEKMMHDTAPKIRLSALGVLPLFNSDISRMWTQALDDKHRDVRRKVVSLMGESRSPHFVSKLVNLLRKEQDEGVRGNAIDALSFIGLPDAIPVFIELLTGDGVTRNEKRRILNGLGLIGDPAAISALTKALNEDKDPVVRWSAAEALGKIGDKAAIPALVDAMAKNESPRMNETAQEAINKIKA